MKKNQFKDIKESIKNKVDSINYDLEDMEYDDTDQEIDCGIGKITYSTNGSMDLAILMTALDEKIKKNGYKSVMNLLGAL